MTKTKILSIILTAFLASCGGGNQSSYINKLLLPSSTNPEDYKDAPEYNAYLVPEENPDFSGLFYWFYAIIKPIVIVFMI